jgi:hypothetical protein
MHCYGRRERLNNFAYSILRKMFELGRNEETRKRGKMYYDTLVAYTFYLDYFFLEDGVGELCSLKKCLVVVEYCLGML